MDHYYFCAYGCVIRWSPKSKSATEAAKYCFGTVNGVTTIDVGTRSPKYFSYTKRNQLESKLKKLHKERTNQDIN